MRVSLLDYEETCKLYREVKTRKRALEEEKLARDQETLLTRAMETLPMVYEEMMRVAQETDSIAYREMMDTLHEQDEFNVTDYLSVPHLFEKAIEKYHHVYWIEVEVESTIGVPCMYEDTCNYQQLSSLPCKLDMFYCPLVPYVYICDTCNVTDFWYNLFDIHGLTLDGLNSYVLSHIAKERLLAKP